MRTLKNILESSLLDVEGNINALENNINDDIKNIKKILSKKSNFKVIPKSNIGKFAYGWSIKEPIKLNSSLLFNAAGIKDAVSDCAISMSFIINYGEYERDIRRDYGVFIYFRLIYKNEAGKTVEIYRTLEIAGFISGNDIINYNKNTVSALLMNSDKGFSRFNTNVLALFDDESSSINTIKLICSNKSEENEIKLSQTGFVIRTVKKY